MTHRWNRAGHVVRSRYRVNTELIFHHSDVCFVFAFMLRCVRLSVVWRLWWLIMLWKRLLIVVPFLVLRTLAITCPMAFLFAFLAVRVLLDQGYFFSSLFQAQLTARAPVVDLLIVSKPDTAVSLE